MCFLCVCRGWCLTTTVWVWRSENNLRESLLSFYHLGLCAGTQVDKTGSGYLHPRGHEWASTLLHHNNWSHDAATAQTR